MFKLIKVLVVFVFVSITFSAIGQKAKVVSAYNYLKYGEVDKAKEAIDLASTHEKSIKLAKTWYYRGRIYLAIYESKDPTVKALDPSALNIAYESLIKASDLDVKEQYTDDVTNKLEYCSVYFVNQGVKDYSDTKYESALSSFENAIAINNRPAFNKIDTLSIYNAALTCEKLNQKDKAINYYRLLLGYQYGGVKIYSFLINIYKSTNDNTKRMDLIQEGRKAYPDDNNLIIEELNYYIETGEKDKAITNLRSAIEQDGDNYNLYYALGSMHDQAGDFNSGESAYKRALELAKPAYNQSLKGFKASMGTEDEIVSKANLNKVHNTYFSILYNYGALYFNQGVKEIQKISTISNNTIYAREKKRAEEQMVKALPYLEKALELKPKDKNTITSLKDLYARVGNDEKWKNMQDKLEN